MDKFPFYSLHTHTEYSALDGASRYKDLIKKAAKSGMPGFAITDHGMMNASVGFYKAAREAGIKPIIGTEAYVTPMGKSRFDKVKLGDGEKNAHHLILLAKNKTGVKNANLITTAGHLEGFYYKPRVDLDFLREHSEGLIALTACMGGAIPQAIQKQDFEYAKQLALVHNEIFKGDFYLELQDHGDPQQDVINKAMIELSEATGIRLVATNDSHFTNKADKALHDVILALQTGSSVKNPNKKLYYTDNHYFKTPEEMWSIPLFAAHPESLINTARIAEQCNFVMELGVNRLPPFPVPEGFTEATYLRHLTYEGLRHRYDHISEEVQNRADFELKVIEGMGFPGYLLIVWDFIDWARRHDIPVGPGRGSAAGSIICYSIGITDIDPLPHGLLFERFLNPERVSMPDIDVDFCIENRQRVMNYVAEKYGDDRVCQIVTFGTLAAKQAFKDVARVMDIPFSVSDQMTKLMGDDLGLTIEKALEIEEFRIAVENDPAIKEVVEMAKQVEGMVKSMGTHPAGVIIADEPVAQLCALMRVNDSKKKSDDDNEGAVRLSSQTQIEQKDAEEMGLLKMDFLGLRNLTMIAAALKMIHENHGITVDWHARDMKPMDDPAVYRLISTGATMGMFQIEGDGITKLVTKMKPTQFGDLSALLALYRPGPLGSNMDDLFVKCKHGELKPDYPHPDLIPYLEDTYGTLIYQEQIMQISQTMAGYSLGEADLLRRAMGKKKPEEMAAQHDRFVNGSIDRGYNADLAESVFEKMAKFAEYGFNRAHSAAYAVITYRTAWIKTHYPAEFMAALMSSVAGKKEKILTANRECAKLGIQVLPPDVNLSNRNFAVVEGDIRFGLLTIQGIGEDFVNSIVEQRKKGGQFKSLHDFCKRVSAKTYNGKSLQNLVKAGAFDSMERNRAKMIVHAESILPSMSKEQKAEAAGQMSLFGDSFSDIILPQKDIDVTPFTEIEELEFERELIGIYVSSHPLKALPFNHELHLSHYAGEITVGQNGQSVVLMGIIRNLKRIVTKRTQKHMAFGKFEDTSGIVDFVLFPDDYANNLAYIGDDRMVQMFGKVGIDKDGAPQVIVSRVREVDELKSVHVVMSSGVSPSSMTALERLIPQYRGLMPLVFEYPHLNKLVLADPKYWVDYSPDLVETIESMVGEGCVSLR